MIKAGTPCIIVHSIGDEGSVLGYPAMTLSDSVSKSLISRNSRQPYSGLMNRIRISWRGSEHEGWYPTAWLKPLPPLSEPESEAREKELTCSPS